MTLDTTRLRELAEKATPGPWNNEHEFTVAAEHTNNIAMCRMASVASGWAGTSYVTPERVYSNAAYIAAANPATMTALLDELERLRNPWQPIATAPRDGTVVMLWLRSPWSEPLIAYWFEPWGNWQLQGYRPDSREDEISGIGANVPSHWMPLPAAPGALNPNDGA